MYRCDVCGKQSKAGEKQNKRVAENRNRLYENTFRQGKKLVTKKSEGFEIVREVAACAPCAKEMPV